LNFAFENISLRLQHILQVKIVITTEFHIMLDIRSQEKAQLQPVH